MEIETDYAARLFYPSSAFVQVYFEAVANAFDAEASVVSIRIVAEPLEVTISDNGKGFTNERFDRFARLTTPVDNYHKGVGRLVYLKYFSSIHVTSVFDGMKRSFHFSKSFKGKSLMEKAPSEKQETTLRFSSFAGDRLQTKDDIKPAVVKDKLLEQFLPLLHNKKKSGQEFRINIELVSSSPKAHRNLFSNSQAITGDDVPALACKTFRDNSLGLFGTITMSYALRPGSSGRSLTAVCIDDRTIPIPLLNPNAIPPNRSVIFLFESDLFVGRSDTARQRFVLPDGITETTVYRVLRREMSAVLNETIPEIQQKNSKTKQHFEDRYPHLTGLFEEDTVGIINKDEAIEIAQHRFFEKQRTVLERDSIDDATFRMSLEVSSRALMEYILYRELIIRRLGDITGKHKESDVHDILVPRYQRFHEGDLIDGIYTNNAWILDDKFMSFRTILSEVTMQEVIGAITLTEGPVKEEGRPDIAMIFSADPAHVEKVDVVVIEIKRRTAGDKENTYVVAQLRKTARKLADYCLTIQRMWYFAILDIDDALSQLLLDSKWTPLFSRGRVFYQDFDVKRADGSLVPTPTCLLSYDAVIKDAADRNHTFLKILKSAFRAGPGKDPNRPTDSTASVPAAPGATTADQAAPSDPEPSLPQPE